MPISVAIVSYNSRDLLRDCLSSIEAEQCSQVTVVDNASCDGSGEMVKQEFPWVRLITNKENRGFGAAANMAIAGCASRYVLLLNCDTLLQPGTLQALSDYLDLNPQAAIVGPSLVNWDGTEQASCFAFPTPLQTLLRETNLSAFIRSMPGINFDNLLMRTPRFAQAVPWVLGAALGIRCLAFESVGGFDESFFMYFEEVDLCYRLERAGWQTHFVPTARIAHVGGASTKKRRTAMVLQLYKSLCHFYRQHYSERQKVQLKVILTYLMFRNIVRDTFGSSRPTAHSKNTDRMDDLLVWRSVLSGVWSMNGWLSG